MKKLIRVEEAFFFLLSIYLYHLLDFRWWWFPVLILAPDLAMLGYIANTRSGAVIYNLVHHRAVAVSLYIGGGLLSNQLIQLIGVILFAHSSIDRVFHYGLKYPDRFQHTHLSD